MPFPLLCRPWGTTIYFLKDGNFLIPSALKLFSSGRLIMQKSTTLLPRLPTLPDCESAALPKWGRGQPWPPPHTALLLTALPAQLEHWLSACYRKILYLTRRFTAAISMVPRTLLAKRCFTVQPRPGQIPTPSIWAAPTWTSVLSFRAPYWPWRHNLSVTFPKRVSDRCILTVY